MRGLATKGAGKGGVSEEENSPIEPPVHGFLQGKHKCGQTTKESTVMNSWYEPLIVARRASHRGRIVLTRTVEEEYINDAH